MLSGKLKKRLSSFWALQSTGWALYGVLIYISFLTVVPPEGRWGLLQVKLSRTVAGFLLTSAMRLVYKRLGKNRSFLSIAIIILVSSVAFGCLWPFGERIGLWLMNRPRFGFGVNWARYPIEVLDYTSTLISWSALYFGIKYWQAWQEEREHTLAANALAHQAQLEMLRYQLNPHFLFNALNSIRASIDEDSLRAKRMITEFSEFLRYSLLNGNAVIVPLREELEALRNYLAIEKIRFEEKLEVSFAIDPLAEDVRLPVFLLHPLVENAIKHGMTNATTPLRICLEARVKNGALWVEVANTGRLRESATAASGTGTGLKNVRQRLAQLFPERSRFEIFEDEGWIRARIEIAPNPEEKPLRVAV
jgi:two-component system, LytTR family, sensor kinase